VIRQPGGERRRSRWPALSDPPNANFFLPSEFLSSVCFFGEDHVCFSKGSQHRLSLRLGLERRPQCLRPHTLRREMQSL
jgi:hypothetical protein